MSELKDESALSRLCTTTLSQYYPKYLIFLSLSGVTLPGTPTQKAKIINTLKKEGFIKGIPDFSVMIPEGKVVHIELKHPNGKGVQSDDQKKVEQMLLDLGHNYYLENTLEGVLKAMSKQVSKDDRQLCFDELVSSIRGTDVLSEPFLYFPKGTTINKVHEVLKSKYYLKD